MEKALRSLLVGMAIVFGAQASASASAGVAPSTVAQDACTWDRPGVNPFMGDVVAAVDRYRDIPANVRARLKARMAKREYDDLVSIKRDGITGRAGYDYGSAISDMHFGTNRLCHSVTRAAWSAKMEERGLVYCESGHCILVPTVCRNVSRLTRKGVAGDSAHGAADPAMAKAPLPEIEWFGPPGAGVPASAEAFSFEGAPLTAAESTTFASAAGGPIGFVAAETASHASNAPLYERLVTGVSFFDSATMGNGASLKSSTSDTLHAAAPVAPVPEPETWCLMLTGLALLGASARRRGARHPMARAEQR